MEIEIVLALFLIIVTAFLFSPLGLGGGVLYMPILHYLVGWEISLSVLGSLMLILFVSLGSRMAHMKGGYAIIEIGKSGVLPAILGAIFGTLVSYFLIIFLGDFTIKIAASGLLIWVIIKTIRQLKGENTSGDNEGIAPEKITKEILNKYRILCFFGGMTSGALGMGSGMLLVTFHRTLFSWRPHYAAGTSAHIVMLMVPVGIISHLIIDGTGRYLLDELGGSILIIAIAMPIISWLGSRTAIKLIPQRLLTYPFLLAVIGSLMRYVIDIAGII
ncbi:MAG: sulfite exporter TauE/SafE family protein [Candidatus Thalassarchaeaceae archaeon]